MKQKRTTQKHRPVPRRVSSLLGVLAVASATTASADNIAPLGTGIIGVNDAIDADLGVPHANAGSAAAINDMDIGTRVDSYFGGTDPALVNSYVGILWPTLRYDQVENLVLQQATFTDGGWFGVNGIGPVPGDPLTPDHLSEPSIQITSDGGVTWTTVPHTSDYGLVMNGHGIGGGANPNPTSVAITFTLNTPASKINGIRIIGPNGGAADGNGFIGVWELDVNSGPSADTDSDGLPDNWELDNGFNIGANEAADDPDGDGLPNTGEYANNTDPHVADSDGDGLNDGFEVNTSFTNPMLADTDGDGLTDSEEVNTHNTNPNLADSDLDGLSDGDEVNIHHTNPNLADTDGDTFNDNIEVAQGSDPTNALSIPNNLALFGHGYTGVKQSMTEGEDIPYEHAGVAASVNDGNPNTAVDTYNGDEPTTVGFVGVTWDAPVSDPISSIKVLFATFLDGGWFGPNNATPGPGNPLTAAQLTTPEVQITTDGFTWTTVPATSDYIEKLTGHKIGNPPTNPTKVEATFELETPAENIFGIRLIGTEGGNASGGFLGIFEFQALTASADSDNDRMDDTWERQHGLIVGTDDSAGDPDSDGLSNVEEYNANTDPQDNDTDKDGLTDGAEVTAGTNPIRDDTDSDGLLDGAEVNTHGTDPKLADTDGDGYNDGVEIAQGTDPKSASSAPNNLAPRGTAILGTSENIEFGPETPHANAGAPTSINDFNPDSRVDTWNNLSPGTASYVGILWDQPLTSQVTTLQLDIATFFDGGWFGNNNVGPGASGQLNGAEHLVEPFVQISTDHGTNWTTVPHTSDYLTVLEGQTLPVAFGPPTRATATFTLDTPATGINGIRLIGSEGGTASGGFLGVFELRVQAATTGSTDVILENFARSANQFTFEFQTQSGKSHLVQYKNSLSDPNWTDLTTITGDGTKKPVTDTATEPHRFYIVRTQ